MTRYVELIARTTVFDIGEQALAGARAELGATGLSATVNAALRQVARSGALRGVEVRRDIDGTPQEVRDNRRDRGTS